MSVPNYQQSREDFEYLESTYGTANYNDQSIYEEELLTMLHSPSKVTARKIYQKKIRLWFQNGMQTHGGYATTGLPEWGGKREEAMKDERLFEIAIDHLIIDVFDPEWQDALDAWMEEEDI